MKKYCFTIFISFATNILSSQNTKQHDSLNLLYKNQPLGIEKINIAEKIFINSRKTNPKLALKYLYKG